LGDARAYYLSTAKNELGVVSATSDAGNSSLSTWFIIHWNLGFRVFHYNIGFSGLGFRVMHCKWLLGFTVIYSKWVFCLLHSFVTELHTFPAN
jgi:hypothetical protein